MTRNLRLLFSVGLALVLLSSCTQEQRFSGRTQGTTYNIVIPENQGQVLQSDIDSILWHFDFAVSHYNPASLISAYNAADTFVVLADTFGYFSDVYFQSFRFQKITEGAFNPGLLPFMERWNWEEYQANRIPQIHYHELDLLGMDDNRVLTSLDPESGILTLQCWKDSAEKLDFNALAQGFSVDLIAQYLDNKGIDAYLVEIGGEMRLKGLKKDGNPWRVAIETAKEKRDGTAQEILDLTDCSIATSGSYRKFIELDGQKFPHILDPRTGMPVNHNLLSVTVIVEKCADADALATAFLVMGKEASIQWIHKHPKMKIEAYFIEEKTEGAPEVFFTPGIAALIPNGNE